MFDDFFYGEREVKVTQERIAQAAANGISAGLLRKRVYTEKMPIEYAVTKPDTTNRITDEEVTRAAANGIAYKTLSSRINRLKWDRERAITKPVDMSRSIRSRTA